jgi:hypothetical protein
MNENVVWVCEKAFDYERSSIEAVFANEEAALDWLRAMRAQDVAIRSEYDFYPEPSDIVQREGYHDASWKWWQYTAGEKTVSATPWELQHDHTPDQPNGTRNGLEAS